MDDSARSAHPLGPRFEQALSDATDHHRAHTRKGTRIPYVAHLLAVAAIVLEMEASEDEAIAALLHDVVEDGGGPSAAAEIRERFGNDVAEIVLDNSDSPTGSPEKAPWPERKRGYVAGIAAKSPAAVRVSIADKLHNARSIVADHGRRGDEVWTRFNRESDQAWYYGALLEAFEARRSDIGPGGEAALDQLGEAVGKLQACARPTGRT